MVSVVLTMPISTSGLFGGCGARVKLGLFGVREIKIETSLMLNVRYNFKVCN